MELIVSNEWIALVLIFLLWQFLNYLFKKNKMDELYYKKLEYVWVIAGMVGLMITINKNKMYLNDKERKIIKNDVEIYFDNLKLSLNPSYNCLEFHYTKNAPDNFNDRQSDQNKICEWSKDIIKEIYRAEKNNSTIEYQSKKIILRTRYQQNYYNSKLKEIEKINYQIKKLKQNNFNKQFSGFIVDIINIIGTLFLIVAFSIRLSIISHQIDKIKNKL